MLISSALTVTQLNFFIKSMFDAEPRLKRVTVIGEISNFVQHYKSGHLYFSLKDENAAIKAVMFRTDAVKLRFRPENGMRVVLTGRVSVFERDGQYQLYAESLIPAGEGALAIAFAQLREKLAKEGLFDDTRKKPIPRFPHKIGVVTAKSGAAVRDILQILNRRWPMAQVVLSPVLVQGAGAAASIAAALKQLNLAGQCDVLIVGRGGGSMEDLWAFNEEIVVRAVADSVIPVISAVGHETDFTLCDFAADLRAPTPSAAAELAVPNQTEMAETVFSLRGQLRRAADGYLSSRQYALSLVSPQANRRRILNTIDNQMQYCDSLQTRLQTAVSHRRDAAQNAFGEAVSRLEALSPLKVLSRGYALCEKEGAAVDSIQKLQQGDRVSLRFWDGSADCEVIQTEEKSHEKANL